MMSGSSSDREFTQDHYYAIKQFNRGHVSEYLDFFIGEKSVLYGIVSNASGRIDEKIQYFQEVCDEFGRGFIVYDHGLENESSYRFVAAESPEDAVATKQLFENESRDVRGEALGYPECCYTDFMDRGNADASLPSILDEFETYPFYTNQLQRFNHGRALVSHFPCSYDCEGTIEIGKRRLELLAEYDPERATDLVQHMSSFIISVHGRDTFAASEYERDGNTVTYESMEPVWFGETDEELNNLLNSTNTVYVEDANTVHVGDETLSGDDVAVLSFEIPAGADLPEQVTDPRIDA